MAKKDPIIDPKTIDWDACFADRDGIADIIPHRFEMALLDQICKCDLDGDLVCGWRDVKADEFWAAGHIPGYPLFPGVLIVETAAQLCTYHFLRVIDTDKFFAFAAIESVRFRGQVQPGNRLCVAARGRKISPRQGVYDIEAYVEERLVMQGRIMAMPISMA